MLCSPSPTDRRDVDSHYIYIYWVLTKKVAKKIRLYVRASPAPPLPLLHCSRCIYDYGPPQDPRERIALQHTSSHAFNPGSLHRQESGEKDEEDRGE